MAVKDNLTGKKQELKVYFSRHWQDGSDAGYSKLRKYTFTAKKNTHYDIVFDIMGSSCDYAYSYASSVNPSLKVNNVVVDEDATPYNTTGYDNLSWSNSEVKGIFVRCRWILDDLNEGDVIEITGGWWKVDNGKNKYGNSVQMLNIHSLGNANALDDISITN